MILELILQCLEITKSENELVLTAKGKYELKTRVKEMWKEARKNN